VAEGTRLFEASEVDFSMKLEGLKDCPIVVKDNAMIFYCPKGEETELKPFIKDGRLDYERLFKTILSNIQDAIKELEMPDGISIQGSFTPCDSCSTEFENNRKTNYLAVHSHCAICAPVVTHTKIGACLVFKDQDKKFLTMDLVPMLPVTLESKQSDESNTILLFQSVVNTLVEQAPIGWLKYLKSSILSRDAIHPFALEQQKNKTKSDDYVAVKIINYGNDNNMIIMPAQSMQIDNFEKNNLRNYFTYVKALKVLLDIDVKSYFLKKVCLTDIRLFGGETPSLLAEQMSLFNIIATDSSISLQFYKVINTEEWRKRQYKNTDFDDIPLR
jgi:hypothetical protein